MPYQHLDHTADLGIRGIGDTLQEALEQTAQAMLDAIADTQAITPSLACPITCSASDIPTLMIEWLNELLYQAEIHQALWHSTRLTDLRQTGDTWTLHGTAHGEPLDLERHILYTEVKAATYAGLAYHQRDGHHILECVLDL